MMIVKNSMAVPSYPKLKPYSDYKDSGVEWLGKIPVNWKCKRLKFLKAHKRFAIVDGPFGTQLGVADYTMDGVPLIRVGDLDFLGRLSLDNIAYISEGKWKELKRSAIEAGDIVIAKTGATIGKSGLVPFEVKRGLIASSCLKVSPDLAQVTPEFIRYCLVSDNCQRQVLLAAGGSTRDTINISPFSDLSLPRPSLREQCTIVKFLDCETEKINALVAKKEPLIELLQEKRAALITHAVTKGLDPSVPMKDSDVEWLGRIPGHWKMKRYKFVTRRVDVGIAEAATHAYADSGIPIIRSTNVRPNEIKTDDVLYIEEWFAKKNRSKFLYAGDIVTVRTGNAGISAVVPSVFDKSQCFTLLISSPRKGQVPQFYSYYLNSHAGQTMFQLEGWGTAQVNISVPILQNVLVVEPPCEEQQNIVSFLDRKAAKLDALIAKVREGTERLKEYRTALISAAVTGKIDVRVAVRS